MRGSSGGGDHGTQRTDATQGGHGGEEYMKAYSLWGGKQPHCLNTDVQRGSLGGTQIYPLEKCCECTERGETSRKIFARGSTRRGGGGGGGGVGREAGFHHRAGRGSVVDVGGERLDPSDQNDTGNWRGGGGG